MLKILGYIVVGIVYLLITGPYFAGIPSLLVPLFWENQPLFWIHFTIATSVILMSVYIYTLTWVTGPGYVPPGWTPQGSVYTLLEYNDSRSSSKRYCMKCNQWKPPRTHHCSACKKCVLKMDHHCPWINNCVGHHNHKYFILFLVYIIIAISYLLWLVYLRASQFFSQRVSVDIRDMMLIFVLGVINIGIVLGVFVLLLWQLYLISYNTTTIEFYEQRDRSKSDEGDSVFPYDLGRKENFKELFGRNPWLWLIPTPPEGTGCEFRVSQEFIFDIENQRLLSQNSGQIQDI